MSMAYIRKHYRVPAKRGMRVCYTGHRDREELTGTITGSKGARLRVRMDPLGNNKPPMFLLHPTWELQYLTDSEAK